MAIVSSSDNESIAAVAKALHMLRAFVDGQSEWGVRELGVALGMPPTTVHRVLGTLKSEGFVRQLPHDQKYSLGFEFARLAAAGMQRHGLAQAASSVMREVSDRTGESVWLALYDDARKRIAYISESESRQMSRYVAPLGREEPLTSSACGLAILARLPEDEQRRFLSDSPRPISSEQASALDFARHNGYALLRSPEVGSTMMIAAPVSDAEGVVVGAIGLVVPLHRFGEGQDRILGDIVRDAGWRVSLRLGARLLGGSSSGTWGDAVGLINQVLKTHMPEVTVSPSRGGGTSNLEALGRGMGAYALTTSSSLFDACHGRGAFSKPLTNLRAVMNLSELVLLVIARHDLVLRSTADLAGLRTSPGEQGFSAAQVFDDMVSHLRQVQKMRRKAAKLLYLDYPEGKRQFEREGVDVLFWLSGLENQLARDIELSGAARLHVLDDAAVDALCRINPGYHRGVIPQSAFPLWLDGDRRTLAVHTVLVCTEDRPEPEVFAFAQALLSEREALAQMSTAYRRLDAKFASQGIPAPLHPGAENYFSQALRDR